MYLWARILCVCNIYQLVNNTKQRRSNKQQQQQSQQQRQQQQHQPQNGNIFALLTKNKLISMFYCVTREKDAEGPSRCCMQYLAKRWPLDELVFYFASCLFFLLFSVAVFFSGFCSGKCTNTIGDNVERKINGRWQLSTVSNTVLMINQMNCVLHIYNTGNAHQTHIHKHANPVLRST